MKRQILTALAVAALAAAPAMNAQSTTTQPRARAGQRMQRSHPAHGRMAQLNLTDAQKTQIKAIRARYEPQMKAERDRLRPQMEAGRAARGRGDSSAAAADRANVRAQMEPMRRIQEQERAEIRGILTPDQQAKFDTMKAQHTRVKGARKGNRGNKSSKGNKGNKGSKGSKAGRRA